MNDFVITTTNLTIPATITIATTEITENWTKALIGVAYPASENEQDKTNPLTNYAVKILDILSKMERRVTITGHISTGYGASDTHSNAFDKADDLRNAFQAGGLMTINYYAGLFDGLTVATNYNKATMDKMEIKKIPSDAPDNTDGVSEFEVNLSWLIGQSMTGNN